MRKESVMKLYEVPDKTRVRVLDDIQTPVGSPEIKKGDILFFHHIDGMYSYCERDGEVVHLTAWAEVEINIK
jgi:hypothetical protein